MFTAIDTPVDHRSNSERFRDDEREHKSHLDLMLEYDHIIQVTPIGERAESEQCQEAYRMLEAMNRTRFHVCTVCHNRYGNDQTYLEIKTDADVPGICQGCRNAKLGSTAIVD